MKILKNENKNKILWFIGIITTIIYWIFMPKIELLQSSIPIVFILGLFIHIILPLTLVYFFSPSYGIGVKPLVLINALFLFIFYIVSVNKQIQGIEYIGSINATPIEVITVAINHQNLIRIFSIVLSIIAFIIGTGLPFLPFYKKREESAPMEIKEINCPRCGQVLSSLDFYCHKCKLPLK